jgi:hypothetical protein
VCNDTDNEKIFGNSSELLKHIPISSDSFLDPSTLPTGLRLAFIGDSVTRYQSLHLMYYLHHNRTWQSDYYDDNDGQVKVFKRVKEWNQFYLQSSEVLGELDGKHWCDCFRNIEIMFENRYFYDIENNNTVYYIDKQGNSAVYGRWSTEKINMWDEPYHVENNIGNTTISPKRKAAPPGVVWKYKTIEEIITNHLAKLNPRPTHVIFNEGLHKDSAISKKTFIKIQRALNDAGNITGIYKTTTKRRTEITSNLLPHDVIGCTMFVCLNLSWTHVLVGPNYYFAGDHFHGFVNTLFNQQLFRLLLPKQEK